MIMQISRPVAIGFIVVALIVVGISIWYTFGRGEGVTSGGVAESAYPKSSAGPGVESLGAEPLYSGSGPSQSLPLESQSSGGGKR